MSDQTIVDLALIAYAVVVVLAAPKFYAWWRGVKREEMAEEHPGQGWEAPYRRPW